MRESLTEQQIDYLTHLRTGEIEAFKTVREYFPEKFKIIDIDEIFDRCLDLKIVRKKHMDYFKEVRDREQATYYEITDYYNEVGFDTIEDLLDFFNSFMDPRKVATYWVDVSRVPEYIHSRTDDEAKQKVFSSIYVKRLSKSKKSKN